MYLSNRFSSLPSSLAVVLLVLVAILPVKISAQEESCRLSLHLARFDGNVEKPPEKTGSFKGLKIIPKPFLNRFDLIKTSVGEGANSRVLQMHLSSEGKNSLYKATAGAIGMRIAALKGVGEKNRVIWVTRIRTGMKNSIIPIPMESAEDAKWLSYCLNKRIGTSPKRVSPKQQGRKQDSHEF